MICTSVDNKMVPEINVGRFKAKDQHTIRLTHVEYSIENISSYVNHINVLTVFIRGKLKWYMYILP